MNHTQERALRMKDHAAWCRYIAPRWAEMLRKADADEKRAIWAHASRELKAEIRRIAA